MARKIAIPDGTEPVLKWALGLALSEARHSNCDKLTAETTDEWIEDNFWKSGQDEAKRYRDVLRLIAALGA